MSLDLPKCDEPVLIALPPPPPRGDMQDSSDRKLLVKFCCVVDVDVVVRGDGIQVCGDIACGERTGIVGDGSAVTGSSLRIDCPMQS